MGKSKKDVIDINQALVDGLDIVGQTYDEPKEEED